MAPFVLMLVVLVLQMAVGVPLSLSILSSAILYLLIAGQPLYLVAQLLFHGVDMFTIMAIPFFLLAGELMLASGTSERLLQFSNLLVGRLRGGTAYVNVFASMLFGGCSGSASADIAGIGRMEVDMMTRSGFTRERSVALTVSTSIMGNIIPPSIPLVLVGAVTNTSIGGLLIGGVIPGVLVGLSMAVAVYLQTRGMERARLGGTSLGEVVRTVVRAIPFLMMPVIILGGMLSGAFTPTEASAAAAAWGFLLLLFAAGNFRRKPRVIFAILVRSAVLSASVLLMIGAANVFSWILANEGIPAAIASLLFTLTSNPLIILLLVNIFLLIWGFFMDMAPAIFIVMPILVPLAAKFGIDPVHFGVICIFNLVIGLITPPYGTALSVGSIVFRMPMERMVRHMFPYYVAALVVLALITYVPEIVLFLPRLFHLA